METFSECGFCDVFLLDPAQEAARALMLRVAASLNPPLDTRAAAEEAAGIIRAATPDAELSLHHAGEQVLNVVAWVRGTGAGRRVILNGNLDAYLLGRPAAPDAQPAGKIDDGRPYGHDAADMKGGIVDHGQGQQAPHLRPVPS